MWPTGSLVTWTSTESPDFSAFSIRRCLPSRLTDVPVDFTGVEHGVAAASDVDESGFHGRQHVLDLAQVDVADQGILLGLGDEVLGQDAVFEDADLDSVVALADDHLAVHGFAAGQELGLGDDGAAAAGVAGFAAALLLGLQPGGALDGRDAVVDRGLG